MLLPCLPTTLRGKGEQPFLLVPNGEKILVNGIIRLTTENLGSLSKLITLSLAYAPNEHLDRIKLWQWMVDLPSIPWITVGDFNMVERS